MGRQLSAASRAFSSKAILLQAKGIVLTQQAFNALLAWLSPDREQAALRYEEVRQKLLQRFRHWGCFSFSEELADKTIDRVAEKKPDIYSGDCMPYFYCVARYIYLEWSRQPRLEPMPSGDWADNRQTVDKECEYECLQHCLTRLPRESRRLVVEFFQDERRKKIDHRKRLAGQLRITPNALRIRVHRIMIVLRSCMEDYLKKRISLK